jgi:hypothetical protein
MRKKAILLFMLLILASTAAAKEYIILNSDNWKDIYSGAIYAQLEKKDFKFLISEKHSSKITGLLRKGDKITVIESDKLPFVLDYAGTLERYGLDADTIKASGNTLNIQLAAQAPTSSFLIIDPAYGYDAVSVASFARLTNSYVLFADKGSIDDILGLFQRKPPQRIMIYGDVDKEMIDALYKYRPEIINAGSRYDNNIEIVKKYRQIKPTDQITISSGEILEEGTLAANYPVLFIGKEVVPDSIIQYVKNSGIDYAVLIGNELTRPAKQIKDLTGITVFIKFAQGRPTLGEDSTKVEGLDLFYLPSYKRELELLGARYNLATGTIDLALQNKKDLKTYLKTTVSVLSGEQRIQTTGDQGIELIEGDDRKGFSYPSDLSYYLAENPNLEATIYTTYGEAPNFMDLELNKKVPLQIVDKEDLCEMKIKGVKFDPEIQRLIITAENTGPVNCYVDAMITDMIISDETTTATMGEPMLVEKAMTAELKIKQRMDAVDLEDNKEVHAKIYYGEDQNFLFKKTEGMFRLEVPGQQGTSNTYIILGIIAIIIIAAVCYFRKKRK